MTFMRIFPIKQLMKGISSRWTETKIKFFIVNFVKLNALRLNSQQRYLSSKERDTAANFTGKGHTVVVLDSGAETRNPESNVIYDHDFANGNNDSCDPKFQP